MTEILSFNISLIGLRDTSSAGQARYANAMERLTGRPTEDFQLGLVVTEDPTFEALDREQATVVASALDDAGVMIDVQPSAAAPLATGQQVVATYTCPQCGFVQPGETVECDKCGLVFAKFEREQVQQLQKNQNLEEALSKALQARDEWSQRAVSYLETHPLPENATEGFENVLIPDEIPFLRLAAEEGPILMTSRRLIAAFRDGFVPIPYEMVSDVTVGGGLVVKKNRVRLVFDFHTALPTDGGAEKSMSWQLDKDSSFYKDVIMDWAFARNFMCGSCGARELDFRTENGRPQARCMHCATDHDIDFREVIAIPKTAGPIT